MGEQQDAEARAHREPTQQEQRQEQQEPRLYSREDSRQTIATFRLRPAVIVRMLGTGCAALALSVILDVLRRGVPAADIPAVLVGEWVFVLLFVLVIGWCVALVVRGPRLVLTAEGFRNHTNARRDSVRAVAWKEVTDVQRRDTAVGAVLAVALADGRQSAIVTRNLDAGMGVIEEQVRSRLNDAHGYRPLN